MKPVAQSQPPVRLVVDLTAGTGTKSAAEMRAEEDAWLKSQPTVGECWLCEWRMEGTAEEVLAAQKAHRAEHGVKSTRGRRNLRSLTSFRQYDLDDDELDAIERERRQRALLTGVEIED